MTLTLRRKTAILLGLGLCALGLSGCADMFTVDIPEGGPKLTGDISGDANYLDLFCAPMSVDINVGFDPVNQVYPGGGQLPVGYLAGRAYTSAAGLSPGERLVPGLQPWWIEGEIYENGTALLTLYQSTYLPSGPANSPGAKPFSVFRGTLLDNRLDLMEQPPSCGRHLVAEVGGPAAASTSVEETGSTANWRTP